MKKILATFFAFSLLFTLGMPQVIGSGMVFSVQAADVYSSVKADAWGDGSDRQSKKKKKKNKADRKKAAKQKKRDASKKKKNAQARSERLETHERAYQAQRRGEIQSYRKIKKNVEARLGGKIVGQNLVQTSKGWRYQLTLRGERGRVRRVIVDAHSGQIIAQK